MKLYFLVMTALIELKPGQLTNSLANDDNNLKFKKFDNMDNIQDITCDKTFKS